MTTTTLSVLPDDNVFTLQPIFQSYFPHAKALATVLVYRFMGINLGFGAPTLDECPTPLHMAQVVLAEWLMVLSALNAFHDGESSMSMTNVNDLPDGLHGVATASAVASCKSGYNVPSLAALLGYLADWIGSTIPTHVSLTCGDIDVITRPLAVSLLNIRVSSLDDKTPVKKLFVRSQSLTPAVFFSNLNTLLSRESDLPHVTRVVLSECGNKKRTILLRKIIKSTQHVVKPVDLAEVYDPDFDVTVPETITIPSKDFDDAVSGITMVIGRDADTEFYPILPMYLSDAGLQRVVIQASVDTLFSATSNLGTYERREIKQKAYMLFYSSQTHLVDECFEKALSSYKKHEETDLVALYFTPSIFQHLYEEGELKPKYWSVLFAFEDILTLTISDLKTRTMFHELCEKYHQHVDGIPFKHSDVDNIARLVVSGNISTIPNESVELVFFFEDIEKVQSKISVVYASLRTLVLKSDDGNMYVSEKRLGSSYVCREQIVKTEDGSLVVQRGAVAVMLPFSVCKPWMHGVVVSKSKVPESMLKYI